jgi:membrane protein DedA with SNARE-associated domain
MMLVITITLAISLNRERLQSFSTLGYLGAFLVMLLSNATLILPAPGLFIVFALGSTLNPILVGICAAAGATLGETTGYVAGYSGLTLLEYTSVARTIKTWMKDHGVITIFALSTLPNPFFDLAGLIAGATRMPAWRFMSTALCGKAIQATAIALAGSMSVDWVEQWLFHQ